MSSEEKWARIRPDAKLVRGAISRAERDIDAAENLLKSGDYDWAFAIAYNAMLQAGRALMFSEGFRPKGQHQHVSVVEFAKGRFEKELTDRLLFAFDNSRKKRHLVVYEEAGAVGENEARAALAAAAEFVEKARGLIGKKWPL